MKCPWAFNGLMSTALLMPMMAAPESHLQTAAASTATNVAANAAAHVNFKIVIPTVLYLRTEGANDRGDGAQTVSIMSNGRNVMLNPTARSPDDVPAHGIILSASARKILAQDATCALGIDDAAAATARAHRVNFNTQPLVCTVSMP
jgi:hypothetical protein